MSVIGRCSGPGLATGGRRFEQQRGLGLGLRKRRHHFVLGCAGMSSVGEEISRTLNVPAVDGVACAVRFVESLVALGLAPGRRAIDGKTARGTQ